MKGGRSAESAVISERQKAVLKRQDAKSAKEKAGFFNRKKDQE
jgi:hypothetical protein